MELIIPYNIKIKINILLNISFLFSAKSVFVHRCKNINPAIAPRAKRILPDKSAELLITDTVHENIIPNTTINNC